MPARTPQIPSKMLTDPQLLDGAWRRVLGWYRRGEWAPQPDFVAWELNQNAWLTKLGKQMADGTYEPKQWPLLPHPKKKGQLRHFCQPSVGDQVAFTLLGMLLAPVIEYPMKAFSFGNRWFRGVMKPPDEEGAKWGFRPWSLADSSHYQPYRRAHGLFRRVASWTVDAMLKCEPRSADSQDETPVPDDYGAGLIPHFARAEHWQQFDALERIYWARFDLKLAFPSVKLDVLRERLRGIISEVLPSESAADAATVSLRFSELFLNANLNLYPASLRAQLTSHKSVTALADYAVSLLESVRYRAFPESDARFFGKPSEDDPPSLPRGDGASHPGLPTGLALSPLLLNAYLHPLDTQMSEWMQEKPAAFLRFADDMILLAATPTLLAEGVDALRAALGATDGSAEDANLRLNWDKCEPASLKEAIGEHRKLTGRQIKPFAEWLNAEGVEHRQNLERSAVTAESRNPFMNDLVEKMSELGTHREADVLPANARLRLQRLQEMVELAPDASVVPRETQLVFAANQLTNSFLPEHRVAEDVRLIRDIRHCVREALKGAPDKPKLWRSVWRASLRCPLNLRGDELRVQQESATQWLREVVSQFGQSASGEWVFVPPPKDASAWQKAWPLFASYHRAAMWRALAEVAATLLRIAENKEELKPNSWLFQSFDEDSLQAAATWLREIAPQIPGWLYAGNTPNLPLWEQEALALAVTAFVPRSAFIATFADTQRSTLSFGELAGMAAVRSDARWSAAQEFLRPVGGAKLRRGTFARAMQMALPLAESEPEVAAHFLGLCQSDSQLLRVAEIFAWQPHIPKELKHAARRELNKLKKVPFCNGPDVSKRMMQVDQYQRARRTWLGLGGDAL